MKRRIGNVNHLGLGNPNSNDILCNQYTKIEILDSLLKEMMEEAIQLWFKEWNGLDFNITIEKKYFKIMFGIEATYQYDKQRIISLMSDIKQSSYLNQKAFGLYGSNLVGIYKPYHLYKNKCKFINFIDKWHYKIYNVIVEHTIFEGNETMKKI